MKLRKQYEGHTFGIGCIAWCPFSRYVIACGTDECNELWIWDIEVRLADESDVIRFGLSSKRSNAHV